MNDAKHTKGPWRVKDSCSMEGPHVYGPVHPIDGGDYAPLAGYRGGALSMADARLIAAAPDLLEACEAALPWIGKMIADGAHMNSVAPNACVGAMQRLEAAIRKAKAEGK